MLLLACAFAFTGCAVRANYAQKQWSESLRQLGVVPLYPPREDVQVGDIYLYEYDPEGDLAKKAFDKGDLRIGVEARWNTISVLPELNTSYTQRPSWPATPDSYAQILAGNPPGGSGAGASDPAAGSKPSGSSGPASPSDSGAAIWKQPTSGKLFDSPAVPDRLRLTQFPDFVSTSFTQGNLNALIPIEAVTALVGASGSSAKQITVKIPSAESYAINSSVLLSKLLDYSNGNQTTDPGCTADLADWWKANRSRKASPIKLRPQCDSGVKLKRTYYETVPSYGAAFVWLRVISEVFYARALDIAVSTNKAGGVATAASTAGTPAQNSSTTLSASTQSQLLTDLNNSLASSQSGSTPGGSLKIMGVNLSSISMRRVFEHPVAVGFRGVTLMVHTRTGTIVSAEGTSSAIATVQ